VPDEQRPRRPFRQRSAKVAVTQLERVAVIDHARHHVREHDAAGCIGVAWRSVGKRRSGLRWTVTLRWRAGSTPGRRIVILRVYSERVSGVKTAYVCREGQFEELSWTQRTDRCHDVLDMSLNLGPAGDREDENGKPPAREVLLVAELLIRGDQRAEYRRGRA
jgi:hypothetical protein